MKKDQFEQLLEIVEQSGVPFTLHEHAPARTMADAEKDLSFDIGRIVKTVAFRIRDGRLVLAALRGTGRVDYPRLAALVGVNRRDLSPLSPEEVRELLGVEPGSVSPLMQPEGAKFMVLAPVVPAAGPSAVRRTTDRAADTRRWSFPTAGIHRYSSVRSSLLWR